MTGEEIAISGIAAGGDGVGRLADGRAVFVPRTAPGDHVRLREGSLRVQRNFARAEAGEIVAPASERVTPPCSHYVEDHCGGCQLQHLYYEAQLGYKRAIVGDALRRIGKLAVPNPEIGGAGQQWRYAAKISMAVGGRRRQAGTDGVTIGLHPYDRPGSVFPLVDCQITDVRLMALWRELQAHLDLFPRRMTRLTLRLDREGARQVIAESPGEPWRTADALQAVLPGGDAVVCWWKPVVGAPRVVAGPAAGVPAIAFEPVNPAMSAAARAWAVEQLGDVRDRIAWDLYGGIGETALLLAGRGARVVSVDADEEAVAWARRRLEAEGHGDRVRFIAGRAEDVLPGLPEPHAVVVSPPRAGLPWDVSLRLGGDPVSRLVYISCDPATLARDLHRLSVNYYVRSVRAFDLFPQTAQVETVVHLEGAS